MQRISVLVVVAFAIAGCSGASPKGADAAEGDFVLEIADSLTGGELELKGAYLRGASGWAQALGNGTAFTFRGTGNNLSAAGDVPAGDYDRLRLLFQKVELGGQQAILTQSGVEVAVNVTVAEGGNSSIGLGFAWTDSFFQSQNGLAFTPVLSRLVVTEDGAERLRLDASEISTGSGKAPVARMRIFDATGLEAFVSTFVADSPENPVVANAGNLTFSATASEVLQPGASVQEIAWDISGTELIGNTVKWLAPVSGGNFTVRLTVSDSEGNQDTQTVKLALKPGEQTRTTYFEGTATGAGGTNGVVDHLFEVNATGFDGAPANLTHVLLVLTPGSATVPLSDLDVTLDDAAAKRIGAQTGAGSQHKIDVDVKDPASGNWKVRVVPDPAYQAAYNVTIQLTWTGYNPGMQAFLANYDDGHTHEH